MKNLYITLLKETELELLGNGILVLRKTSASLDIVINFNNVLTIGCREECGFFPGTYTTHYYVTIYGSGVLNLRVCSESEQERWYNMFKQMIIDL